MALRGVVGNVPVMDSETVTVTITSSVGESANLTVNDAMRQILDLFDLLSAAGGKEANAIAWQLVAVSMNSPLRVTARAVAVQEDAPVAQIARREKALVAEGLSAIISGSNVPDWMSKPIREKAKKIFQRNTDGIGRTDFHLSGDFPLLSFEQGPSRRAISTFDKYERYLADKEGDLSRKEYGTIEALVLDTTTFHGHPALNIREWVTSSPAKCVFADDVAQKIGSNRTWAETWARKRVILSGEVTYNRHGLVNHILADYIDTITERPVKYEDVADPSYTSGLSVTDLVYQRRESEGD